MPIRANFYNTWKILCALMYLKGQVAALRPVTWLAHCLKLYISEFSIWPFNTADSKDLRLIQKNSCCTALWGFVQTERHKIHRGCWEHPRGGKQMSCDWAQLKSWKDWFTHWLPVAVTRWALQCLKNRTILNYKVNSYVEGYGAQEYFYAMPTL